MPADFHFFNDCTAASTSLRRMGWSSSVSVWVQLSTNGSSLALSQLRAVFCPSVQYLPLFREAFSWTILDSSRSPLFHSGKVFHQLVCPLTVVLPQIFFSLTTLFSYPVFFSLFHAPLDIVVHFLVFLRSFRFESFLLLVLSFCRTDQIFLQWPRVFSSDDVCQGSHWLFQSLLCWSMQSYFLTYCRLWRENWERKESNLKDLIIQGSEQQHQEVHGKDKRKLDRRTVLWDWRKSEEEQQ